jgi:hypothetical protein
MQDDGKPKDPEKPRDVLQGGEQPDPYPDDEEILDRVWKRIAESRNVRQPKGS